MIPWRNSSTNIITADEFPFEEFRKMKKQPRHRGNPGTKQKYWYKDIITAFDIETTRITEIEQSVMYIWQWAFGPDMVVIGRTWDEFLDFVHKLVDNMSDTEKLMIFTHNLSYEFTYLKGIYEFKSSDIFALDSRKVLRCEMLGKLEFRCSYLQTNMSLAEFTEKMGAKHSKLSGEDFDYSKRRFPWTPMTEDELAYCVHDVIGLVEAMQIQMAHDGDNLYSVCMTSTGYVRRDAKKAMRKVYHGWLTRQLPSWHLYEMCREAFRGGNTHANRFYADQTVEWVRSADKSSAYPDVLVNHLYPSGEFYEIGEIPEKRFRELLRHNRAIIARVQFKGIRLRRYDWGCPYLSKDKSRYIWHGRFDNGRILEAKALECTITDVDFKIIESEYEWESVRFIDVAYTFYGRLPDAFRDLINEYYRRKTELKGVEGRELDYLRSKSKLNSLYGMTAQDPCKVPIVFETNMLEFDTAANLAELLAKDNRRRQLPCYQVGVWVTCWARWELELGIREVYDQGGTFIYTDTDSIKYCGDVSFDEYNKRCIERSTESGAYAKDPKGVYHYMGVFEEEKPARKFRTLGAKKYCYEHEDGHIHLTVAGVNKKSGAKELEENGGIEAFKPSFIFNTSGGVEAVYNDDPAIKEYEIEGHKLKITSNIVLRPSTYTLGITNEYEYLLSICQLRELEEI